MELSGGIRIRRKIDRIILVYYSLLLLAFIFILFGQVWFWKGVHNIELAYNGQYVNKVTGEEFIDLNSEDEWWTYTEMYSYGLEQIERGLYISIMGSLVFGYALLGITTERFK